MPRSGRLTKEMQFKSLSGQDLPPTGESRLAVTTGESPEQCTRIIASQYKHIGTLTVNASLLALKYIRELALRKRSQVRKLSDGFAVSAGGS
jgi:hypothetical protein